MKGFTLIEMLVVVAIGVLMTSVGIASYRNFSRRQILQSAARRLKTDLNLARTNAGVGEKRDNDGTCGCKGGDGICQTSDDGVLAGWEIVETGNTSYVVRGVCDGGSVFAVTPVNLEPNVAFLTLGVVVRFKVLSQGTTLSNDAVFELRAFGSSDPVLNQKVTVNTGGQIQ